MQYILIFAGAIIGMWLGGVSDEVLGIGLGAGIAYLVGQSRALQSQLQRLEDRVTRLVRKQKTVASPISPPPPARTREPPPAVQAPVVQRKVELPTQKVTGEFIAY